MMKFLDGPAAGVVLSCTRAPFFLRVVRGTDSRESGQEWDALDQLADRPRPGEEIHVYVKVEDHGAVHLQMAGPGGRGRRGLWGKLADYRHCEHQPDDATARDQQLWQAWCAARKAEMDTPQTQPKRESDA